MTSFIRLRMLLLIGNILFEKLLPVESLLIIYSTIIIRSLLPLKAYIKSIRGFYSPPFDVKVRYFIVSYRYYLKKVINTDGGRFTSSTLPRSKLMRGGIFSTI